MLCQTVHFQNSTLNSRTTRLEYFSALEVMMILMTQTSKIYDDDSDFDDDESDDDDDEESDGDDF